jgi:hypothetical protein
MTRQPIIVSMTTLPSRIASMRPTLESLLAGELVPDRLLVAIPPTSIRENCAYSIPDFLKDRDFCGDRIVVVEADRDWGSGTKLLGSLSAVPPESYLMLADDDVRYHPRFLRGIAEAQQADHSASFSYYTYRVRGLTLGQGCDGFSFWRPNLDGVRAFAERHIDNTNLMFHDDLWISFFLASKGIQIKSVAPPEQTRFIYEVEHHINALNRLSGDLSRRSLNLDGLRRLMREAPLPWQLRQKIRLVSALDRVWNRPVQKLGRYISRL